MESPLRWKKLRSSSQGEDPFEKCWRIIMSGDDSDAFKPILDANIHILKQKSSKGDSLIHIATLYARIQIVQLLISSGSRINMKDSY
jgi:ankyrin repeat protein